MGTDRDTASAREERLGEVAFACLRRLEAGLPVDREAVLREHPDLAAELAEFFATRDEVDLALSRALPGFEPARGV